VGGFPRRPRVLAAPAAGGEGEQAPAIRPAQPDELQALAQLIDDHALFARYRMTPEKLTSALQAACAEGDQVLSAWQGKRPLGFAWWQALGAFARSPYLRLLVVSASSTGKGVGAALLQALEAAAFAHANDLFLLVTHDNQGAQRLYERHGFERVGVLKDYVMVGIDEVLMRKRRG